MIHPLLDSVHCEADIKKIPQEMLPQLCEELRGVILETVSENGGHLASSLGAVELIIALHRVFNLPEDKIIFDVGHQAYAHKILTDRRETFSSLRKQFGISGFPKREESEYDAFNTGHASTSISAGLGIMRGQQLSGNDARVVCLIGDGALTGGLAYEALDDVGESKLPLIIVLNDNEMSISKNVGGLSKNLSHMRTSHRYTTLKKTISKQLDYGKVGRFLSKHLGNFKNRIKRFVLTNTFFEELGLTYLGPIDGHDIDALVRVFSEARELGKPVLVHTVTKKGKGYRFAEQDPQKFHGVDPFNIETGELLTPHTTSCTDVFSQALCELAVNNEQICAITAAMPKGTGLGGFQKLYPKRFFDVGIAEEHAVTMAAGLASAGKTPVVAIYSSFLQRATDEIYHDVCLQNLPVVFAADRAGLVGRDGETHNGLMDIALCYNMPNMEIFAPSTFNEIKNCLSYCVGKKEGASLLRYNRGALPEGIADNSDPHSWTSSGPESQICVVSYGSLMQVCEEAVKSLPNPIRLICARSLKPIDDSILKQLEINRCVLVVAEEGPPILAQQIALNYKGIIVHSVCPDTMIVRQGTVEEQRAACGIDAAAVLRKIHYAMEIKE